MGFEASPLLQPKHAFTGFWTHFGTLTKTHLKPTLRGNSVFSKKGPEAAATQHNPGCRVGPRNTNFVDMSISLILGQGVSVRESAGFLQESVFGVWSAPPRAQQSAPLPREAQTSKPLKCSFSKFVTNKKKRPFCNAPFSKRGQWP